MKATKSEIRDIALDILLNTPHPPNQKAAFDLAIAEALVRKTGQGQRRDELVRENWVTFNEVFWDLMLDRIITVGIDSAHAHPPWFRLHSEVRENLRRAKQA